MVGTFSYAQPESDRDVRGTDVHWREGIGRFDYSEGMVGGRVNQCSGRWR